MLNEKYGVTREGFSRKRLDEISEEIHADLSLGFGFNTRNNPKSFLGVLVTNFSDKIAELWEVAEQVYDSMVPSTAEGISLDRVAQLGGSQREEAAPSYYTILCTGENGTVIPAGTRIRTDTHPAVDFVNVNVGTIQTTYCVAAEIKPVGSYSKGDVFSVSVDGQQYKIALNEGDNPIDALASVMKEDYVSVKKEHVNGTDVSTAIVLTFEESTPRKVMLSSNLNAPSVTSLIQFCTVEFGDFELPKNSVTQISTAVAGLKSVTNLEDYVKGRNLASDSELRKDFIDKIFIRSRTMLESIRSAILANCNGVESVAAFENDTNEWDYNGCCRAPHSVEIVVIGGDEKEIAEQIFATKAAGVNTSHCDGLEVKEENKDYGKEITVEDDYGKPVIVRFSRPVPMYYQFNVAVDAATNEAPALNTFDLIKEIIFESVNALNPGDDVVPQKFLAELYKTVPGVINYQFDIKLEGSDCEWTPSIQGLGYNRVARCSSKDSIDISYNKA